MTSLLIAQESSKEVQLGAAGQFTLAGTSHWKLPTRKHRALWLGATSVSHNLFKGLPNNFTSLFLSKLVHPSPATATRNGGTPGGTSINHTSLNTIIPVHYATNSTDTLSAISPLDQVRRSPRSHETKAKSSKSSPRTSIYVR